MMIYKYINKNDLEEIDQLSIGDNPDVYIQLLDSYARTSFERVDELKKCLKNENWLQIGKIAHSLRSSSLTLGARKLGKLCEEIEILSKDSESYSLIPNVLEGLFFYHLLSINELLEIKSCKEKNRNNLNLKAT